MKRMSFEEIEQRLIAAKKKGFVLNRGTSTYGKVTKAKTWPVRCEACAVGGVIAGTRKSDYSAINAFMRVTGWTIGEFNAFEDGFDAFLVSNDKNLATYREFGQYIYETLANNGPKLEKDFEY